MIEQNFRAIQQLSSSSPQRNSHAATSFMKISQPFNISTFLEICSSDLGGGSHLSPLGSAFVEEKRQMHLELIASTIVIFPQVEKQPQQWEQERKHDRGLKKYINRNNLSCTIICSPNNNCGKYKICLLPCTIWRQEVAKLKLGPEEEN